MLGNQSSGEKLRNTKSPPKLKVESPEDFNDRESSEDSFKSDDHWDPKEEKKQPVSNGFHLKKVG